MHKIDEIDNCVRFVNATFLVGYCCQMAEMLCRWAKGKYDEPILPKFEQMKEYLLDWTSAKHLQLLSTLLRATFDELPLTIEANPGKLTCNLRLDHQTVDILQFNSIESLEKFVFDISPAGKQAQWFYDTKYNEGKWDKLDELLQTDAEWLAHFHQMWADFVKALIKSVLGDDGVFVNMDDVGRYVKWAVKYVIYDLMLHPHRVISQTYFDKWLRQHFPFCKDVVSDAAFYHKWLEDFRRLATHWRDKVGTLVETRTQHQLHDLKTEFQNATVCGKEQDRFELLSVEQQNKTQLVVQMTFLGCFPNGGVDLERNGFHLRCIFPHQEMITVQTTWANFVLFMNGLKPWSYPHLTGIHVQKFL